MSFAVSFITQKLSVPTSFFGFKLWITIAICIGLVIVLALLCICCYFISCRRRKPPEVRYRKANPAAASKNLRSNYSASSLDRRLLSSNGWDVEMSIAAPEKKALYSDQWSTQTGGTTSNVNDLGAVTVVSDVCRGNRFTLRDIEVATNGFADDNVIGSGDYGIVYRGVLLDNTRVAVKKLPSNRFKAEEFVAKVEAMWRIGHKNLVKLLGYCTEGTYRLLVHEYIDNGNLQQWLHRCIGKVSLLTWDMRMNIVLGTAKG
ncbi:unnamed protein product, partial [Ilex paraguariensis]